jgi:hypothetical protein
MSKNMCAAPLFKERDNVVQTPDDKGLAIPDDEAEMGEYCVDFERSRRDEEFD